MLSRGVARQNTLLKGILLEASFGGDDIKRYQKDKSGNRCLKACTENY